MPDVSFVIFGEAEKNLTEIIHEKDFFVSHKNSIPTEVFQPLYYQMDNLKNAAFLYAAEYYVKNDITKNQDLMIMSALNHVSPKGARDQYYLDIINKIRKNSISEAVDLPAINPNKVFEPTNFFNFLVTKMAPERTKEKNLLSMMLYLTLKNKTESGKKYIQGINVDYVLHSSAGTRNQMINEYVLLLKKYGLITEKIKARIIAYISRHEDPIYGYSLEKNRAYNLESVVYALQVKSILEGGNSLDIH